MPSLAALDLIISIKGADKATKGLSGMGKESGGLSKAMGTLAKVGIGAAVVGIGALVGGMAKALGEASEWENGMAQLNAVLTSTGGKAGMTADEIVNLSQKLSASNGMSKFSDDAVLAGNNLLLTFTGISKDVFPAVSQAAVDMATAMGTDVTSAAMMLGKALNDPMDGLAKLTRAGVSFTDQQKLQIQAMQNSGDIMGAQKVMLGELATEFGGSASAAAGTFSGKMITLQEKLNDVFQAVGEKLMPMMTGFVDWLSKPETMAGIQAFAEGLITGIGEAAKIVGPIIGGIATNVGKFISAVTSGDAGKVKEFWDGIGGPIGAVGGFITTAATEVGKFIGAVASGDGQNVRKFFEDLGGKGSFVAAIGVFLDEATKAALAFFTALLTDTSKATENVSVHSEAWNELYANNGAAQGVQAKAEKDFWTEAEIALGNWKLGWGLFWTKVGKGLEDFWTVWNGDFWPNVGLALENFGKGWDLFWFKVGKGVEGLSLVWDALFGTVFPKATKFHEEVAKSGIVGVTAADDAKIAWDGFLSGVTINVSSSFKQSGVNAGQGFADGITSKLADAGAAAFAMGLHAKKRLDEGIRAKSPSLETYESGQWVGDGFILGMRSKLPEIDAAAAEMGTTIRAAFGRSMPPKSIYDLVHNAVQPGIEAAYSFFREYLGTAHSGLQALIGMMVADSKRGVADILAEWARLNGMSSSGVPVGPDGIPDYQQSPGGTGDPSGGGGYGGGRPPEARAWGGSIRAGMPYWVGEFGPELIIPDMPGEVVPAGRSRNNFPVPKRGDYSGSFGRGGVGGITFSNITINAGPGVNGGQLADAFISEVSARIEQRRSMRNRN